MNDRLSLGLGVSWRYIEAELTQRTGFPGALARMKGDDANWGWNLGARWDIDGQIRLGLAYRSDVSHPRPRRTGARAPWAPI